MADSQTRRRQLFRAAGLATLMLLVSMRVSAVAAPGDTAAPTVRNHEGSVKQASHAAPASDRPVSGARRDSASSNAPPAANAGEKTRIGEAAVPQSGQPTASARGSQNFLTTVGSLAVVLGLLFAVSWAMRRRLPRAAQRLPTEVVELLGQVPLGQRQHAHLLRLGRKLILVNVSPAGAETLSEVTDAAEVDRLIALCREPQTSAAPSFRDIYQQFRGRASLPAMTGKEAAATSTAGRARTERTDV